MSQRYSRIGFTVNQALSNGVFLRMYADVALLVHQMGCDDLIVFKCVRGYVAFGKHSDRLRILGYSERMFGEYPINYTTFPEADYTYVAQRFKLRCITIETDTTNVIVNVNKSQQTNFLLLSTFML